jgi:hypothetical protein
VALLDSIKLVIRVDGTMLDSDIQDTINACKADLKLAGIIEEKILESDPIILRTIKLFCKSEYSSNENESARFREAYQALRNHLALSIDYTG